MHYKQLRGKILRDMMVADGWIVLWVRGGRAQLKKNGKHVGFYLNRLLPRKQIESIAKNKTGWDVKRFNDLLPTSAGKLRIIAGKGNIA